MCWDVLVEFDHQKEDVLGSSDGLVVRIPCLFCSHKKSLTQTI